MKPIKLFDAHLHIIDPRYHLVTNDGFTPDPFTCKDYLSRMSNYELCGGAIVSGSFQGFDQTYLLSALKELGSTFVGVANLPSTATSEDIIKLNEAGVRAVRFNIKRGGSESIEHLKSMANEIYDLCGWHVELYVDAGELAELYNTLTGLPAICIDHLGLSNIGFDQVLRLVEKGAHVKASGFGRTNFNIDNALKQIYSINPNALMFGSDLPSTRAKRPFHDDDVNIIVKTFDETQAENIFYNNALAFYKLEHPI